MLLLMYCSISQGQSKDLTRKAETRAKHLGSYSIYPLYVIRPMQFSVLAKKAAAAAVQQLYSD